MPLDIRIKESLGHGNVVDNRIWGEDSCLLNVESAAGVLTKLKNINGKWEVFIKTGQVTLTRLIKK